MINISTIVKRFMQYRNSLRRPFPTSHQYLVLMGDIILIKISMSDFVSLITVWQTQDLFTLGYLFIYIYYTHQAPEVLYGCKRAYIKKHQSHRLLLIDHYIPV